MPIIGFNGDRSNPLHVYIFTRLMFGHRCAASIAKFGIIKICMFGEEYCAHCKGRYSVTNPGNSKGKRCQEVAHSFARNKNKTYVDDAVLPAPTQRNLDDLIEYAVELLDLFSYSFKGVDVSGQSLNATTKTLDQDGKLSVCGYTYWPA